MVSFSFNFKIIVDATAVVVLLDYLCQYTLGKSSVNVHCSAFLYKPVAWCGRTWCDTINFVTCVTTNGSIVLKYSLLANRAAANVVARSSWARIRLDVPANSESSYAETCIGVWIMWYASGEVSSSTWSDVVLLILKRLIWLWTQCKRCRFGPAGWGNIP